MDVTYLFSTQLVSRGRLRIKMAALCQKHFVGTYFDKKLNADEICFRVIQLPTLFLLPIMNQYYITSKFYG